MVVSACDVPCMHAFFYMYGHLEVVRQLLLSRADKALQNKHGRTALDLARQRNQEGGPHPA